MSNTRKNARKGGRVSGGFLAVIIFKWVKGVAFVIFGIAALRLSRLDIMPSAVEIARFLSVSRENALVHWVADVIRTVTPKQVGAAGIASLFIGIVFFVEGALLLARVWWSTYFTIGLTAMGIPLELWEIAHRPDSIRRYVLFALNVAILVFLWTRRNEFRHTRPAKATAVKKRAAG
ncbi:MAG TPA: DUF2127 domain-containing protein [Thermoanaerobaculia bacterium]|nr:DUF2127 domain-containing protein [Thermoanaerobaculia bacterium]